MNTYQNPIAIIIWSNPFRTLRYPTLFADVGLPIERFRKAPRDSVHELIRRLADNENEFRLSLLVVLSQLLVLLVCVVATVVFSLFVIPSVLDWVSHFDDPWLEPLVRLPLLTYIFSPMIFLLFAAFLEQSDGTASSTKGESESQPGTELVLSTTPEETSPDESHLSPIQRFRKNPKDFVLSNLVFALQVIFFSSCLMWAIFLVACIFR